MAKKAKKKEYETVPWSEARGVASFDSDEIILLVAAPVEAVADEFQKRRKLKFRLENAIGKSITITIPSYVVYRLNGHSWTIVDSYKTGYESDQYLKAEDAQAISKALKTKAIFFANSDTAGATSYDLFENGKRLEHFESFEELEFESSVRDVEAPPDGPKIYDFVQEFMKSHDALAPSWTTYFGSFCHQEGDKIKFEIIPAELLERLDYLSAEPPKPKLKSAAKAKGKPKAKEKRRKAS